MPDELRRPEFDPAVLLDAEAEVVARTAKGEIAVFPEAARPVLRAAFLRHLLLNLSPDEWPIRLPGVRIHSARIEETLDLADSVGLPGLALEACELAAPLDLTNARIARLSLRDSRIGEIRARGLRVEGVLDVAGVAPLDETA